MCKLPSMFLSWLDRKICGCPLVMSNDHWYSCVLCPHGVARACAHALTQRGEAAVAQVLHYCSRSNVCLFEGFLYLYFSVDIIKLCFPGKNHNAPLNWINSGQIRKWSSSYLLAAVRVVFLDWGHVFVLFSLSLCLTFLQRKWRKLSVLS